MRTLALVASLSSLLATVGARAQERHAQELKLLSRVDAELARGHNERAQAALLRALERGPSVALLERYAELALPWRLPASERERAKFARAGARLLVWIERAHDGLVPSPTLALYAAWALALRSEFAASRELVAGAGGGDPARAARLLRAMAGLALARRALGEAQDMLQLARGLAPADLELAGELGMVLLARGDAQQALGPLGERFAADPTQLTARRDFAYALRAAGRAGEAYEVLAAAEACAPADRCLLELARAALEAGKFHAAAEQAEAAIRHEPASLDALFLAAEAEGRRGDREAARALYQRILRAAPHSLRARSALEALETLDAPRRE